MRYQAGENLPEGYEIRSNDDWGSVIDQEGGGLLTIEGSVDISAALLAAGWISPVPEPEPSPGVGWVGTGKTLGGALTDTQRTALIVDGDRFAALNDEGRLFIGITDCYSWEPPPSVSEHEEEDKGPTEAEERTEQKYAELVEAAQALIDDITSEFKDYDLDPLEQAIAAALKALEADRG